MKEKENITDNFDLIQPILPNKISISGKRFNFLNRKPPQSSSILTWFKDVETNSEWIGKCSIRSLFRNDYFDDYKEYLASRLYEFFGVAIPEIALAQEYLGKVAEVAAITVDNLRNRFQSRLYFMSSFVKDFVEVGGSFIKKYRKSPTNQPFCIHNGSKPLRGFGRVMAVSILIYDYDFIGESGKNLGFIPKEDRECFEILKINANEALSFAYDMKLASSFNNPPERREAIIIPFYDTIKYEDLNVVDQKEFVQTLKRILETDESKLKEIFSPFLKVDDRFEIILKELLNRRKKLLVAFHNEIRNSIAIDINNLQEELAQKQMANWGKPILSTLPELTKRISLIRSRAQLEAIRTANLSPQV